MKNGVLDNQKEQIIANETEIQGIKETIKRVSSKETIQMLEDDIEKLRLKNASLKAGRDTQEDKQVDTQITINYTNHFMEHLEELLLRGSDPEKKAALFGLIFEEPPTYNELSSGTPKLEPFIALKDSFADGHFPLVSPREIRWNHLIDSILDLFYELKKLGFTYYNGKISVVNNKEVKS